MKFAILGDCHMTARNGSRHFAKYFNKFFTDVFYPYLIEHNIKQVYQLGDMFDDRNSISIEAFDMCKSVWFDPLVNNDIHMTIILGNHDVYHKNTLVVNSPSLLLKEYTGWINIIDKPAIETIADHTTVALVPWICDANKAEIFEFLKPDRVADLCMGHFEIDGFEMMRGVPGKGGLPRELFDKFERTFSGHYHTQSFDEFHRIQYVGTPYEITYADMHDPRGFHVFDTDTRETTFIQNPYTMHDRIVYNDGWSGDLSTILDKYVKLIVEKKTDTKEFDRFVNQMHLSGVHDLKIIENLNVARVSVEEDVTVENSQTLIDNYVGKIETTVDKAALKTYLHGIYQEAIAK